MLEITEYQYQSLRLHCVSLKYYLIIFLYIHNRYNAWGKYSVAYP